MAHTLEQHWNGPLSGAVVTRYGYACPCKQIEILEAGHPLPDQRGIAASRTILQALSDLTAEDLVIVLISGGGSALLTLPAPGFTLQEKIDLNQQLLNSGAPIHLLNAIRKRLSAVKGGRLALAAEPAKVLTLAISDVPGDHLSTIASGPTVADTSSSAETLLQIQQHGLKLPDKVMHYLRQSEAELPSPDHPQFSRCTTHLIARPQSSLEAAAKVGQEAGYRVQIIGDAIEGEAREVAALHAKLAREQPPGTILLSGGELTVTHPNSGAGGPNTEYALALALALQSEPDVHAIACDTDGIDGSEDNAGAQIDSATLQRASIKGLNPEKLLTNHNSYHFFKPLEDLIITGPTYTNINDFRAILIE